MEEKNIKIYVRGGVVIDVLLGSSHVDIVDMFPGKQLLHDLKLWIEGRGPQPNLLGRLSQLQ